MAHIEEATRTAWDKGKVAAGGYGRQGRGLRDGVGEGGGVGVDKGDEQVSCEMTVYLYF